MNLYRVHIITGILVSLFFAKARGQLSADFGTYDLAGNPMNSGCIPNMIIQFLDLSTNNGTPLPYRNTANGDAYNSHHWDFDFPRPPDPPNTSNVRSPVYGYFTPGTYCITLTVTPDGINYDSVTKCIVVFDPPDVNIAANPTTGCNPLNVCFTDLSTAPNASIVSWLWDFGDGSISTQQHPCHTFQLIPQQNCFSVTLIVTSSQGCRAAETFNNIVCIDLPPVANFTASDSIICGRPFTVTFTNVSQSFNTLAYFWEFGDGNTSTQQHPAHTYTTDSVFTVKLTVTDTECGDTASVTKTIVTSDIDANFVTTTPFVCAGSPANFYDNNSVGQLPLQYGWNFGDNTTSVSANPQHVYQNPGIYSVTLTVTDAVGCTNTEVQTNAVTVRPRPAVDFTSSASTSCQAPFEVSFNEQADPGVSFSWNFGDPGTANDTSSAANPSYTFQNPGNFNVTLEVTDPNTGCTNTITKNNYVQIQPRTVAFTMDIDRGCAPLTVNFTNTSGGPSNDPFVIFWWDFGDSLNPPNNSALPNPSHTFPDTGKFVITFYAATAGNRCFAEITDTVLVGLPILPEFSIDSTPACVNEEINFNNETDITGVSDSNAIQWVWNFGGLTVDGRDPPPQAFDEPEDSIGVTLTVIYHGCRADTSMKIEILDPKADFFITQNCRNPATIIITDSSENAHTWRWYFGDGDSLLMPFPRPYQDTIHYTYDSSGNYQIRLEVSNLTTQCEDDFTQSVQVSVTNADFDANNRTICLGDTVCFQNRSTGTLTSYNWNFGDNPAGTSSLQSPCYIYNQPGIFTVRLVVNDINGCSDTMIRQNFITVSGVMADFNSPDRNGCLPPTGNDNTIIFNDLSTASTGTNIVRWEWNFGDSQTAAFTNPPATSGNTSHTYTAVNSYNVSLRVVNNLGCDDTETKTNFIDIRRPVACISVPYALYCEDQPALINHCSQGTGIVRFEWDFGDGQTGTGAPVYHTYSDTGCYDITLRVTDNAFCTDSTRLDSALCVSNPYINFGAPDTTSVCPPHVACFTNLSSFQGIGIRSVLWDFGDRSFSTLQNPCHVYNRAGLFAVTLHVTFDNYCIDSLTKTSYISVGGAVGNITADPDTGCVPMDMVLDANSIGAISHFWITPWSETTTGRLGGDTIHTIIQEAGFWTPAVVLTDSQNPPCSYVLYADFEVAADTVYSLFGTRADTVCREDPVQFTDSSTALIDTHIVAWFWDFGDGTTDTVQNPIHSFRSMGSRRVCLTAYNGFGCSSTSCMNVFVRDKPNAVFTVSDTSGCDSLLVNFFDASAPGISAPLTNWFWDFDDRNISHNVPPNPQNPVHLYPDTGQYYPYLVVTDADGCDDTATVRIGVYRTPLGILSPDTVDICYGDTTQLFSDSGYAAYLWSPAGSLSSATVANPLAFPLDTTNYSVSITEAHGCNKLDTMTVNVIPLPPLTVTPYPDTAICIGDTIQLIATGGSSHSWFPPVGLSSDAVPNPLASPPYTITYTVTNVGAGGCTNSRSVTVTVSSLNADFIGERSCFGDATDFIDFSTHTDLPITSWTWYFGEAGAISNVQNPTYTYSEADTFLAQLVIGDNIGCTDTATQFIIIDTPATAVAGFDTTICFGDTANLFSSGGDTMYWTPGNYVSQPNSFNTVAFPPVTTTFVAHITNGVCPYDLAEVEVTVLSPPDVQTIDNTTILRGTNIQLVTTVDRYDSIIWTPADSLSCTFCLSPFATPDESITYRISVFDEYGCTNYDEVTIDVEVQCKEDQIWVASAFTPNGDGINDKAFVRLIGLERLNYFKVFDRWGKLIFETTQPSKGWDGTSKDDGQKLNTGVYVYVAEAVCWYRQTIVKSGNITLIK
ncbi:MAG TPA: PKD domain-containing protein [Chitinophagales bacterium]|nr:PKD domain-containing protein [Chitinophagales bacterium]